MTNNSNTPVGGESVTNEDKTLGQMLKKVREEKNLTIHEAENGAGIPHGYLSNLEADKYKQPSAHALYNLAKLYEVELKPLLIAGGLIIKKQQHD